MELYPFQTECLEAVQGFVQRGGKRGLIVLPTGCGKTAVAVRIPVNGNKTLWIAHRKELLDQARVAFLDANPSLRVDIEQAERTASPLADVTIASIQTLAVSRKRLQTLAPEEYGLVVVDEAHHVTASSYLRVLAHFSLVPPRPQRDLKAYRPPDNAPLLIGLTATPNRADHVGLENVLDEIVYVRTLPEMIDGNWLVPILAYRWKSETDISGVRLQAGDFQEGVLSRVVNNPRRNALAAAAYMQLCAGRRAIVYCVDVEHVFAMLEVFLAAGIRAAAIVGSTPASERDIVIQAFRVGDLDVLVNCAVLSEGLDVPPVSAIIMARPTTSSVFYAQCIGRGTRISPGKQNMVLLDIEDSAGRVKPFMAPDLFGLPAKFDAQGRDLNKLRKHILAIQGEYPGLVLDGAANLGDVTRLLEEFNLFEGNFLEDRIRAISKLRWFKTSEGYYILSLANKEWVSVNEDILGRFSVYAQAESLKGLKLPVLFGTFSDAIRFADGLVFAYMQDRVGLVINEVRWQKDPATKKQIGFLKLLSRRRLVPYKISDYSRLTKGQAQALITLALGKEK